MSALKGKASSMLKRIAAPLMVWTACFAPAASADPAIANPETFSLWRVPAGVFDTGQIWLDETHLVREANRAEYWILKIELSNLWTPNGDYAGIWQKVSTDCAANSETVAATIAVNTMNYEVMREEKAGQPLLSAFDSTVFGNIRKRVCTPDTQPDAAPRATIFARAVIWTRDAAAWEEVNGAQ
jgi:hypothetical protein